MKKKSEDAKVYMAFIVIILLFVVSIGLSAARFSIYQHFILTTVLWTCVLILIIMITLVLVIIDDWFNRKYPDI